MCEYLSWGMCVGDINGVLSEVDKDQFRKEINNENFIGTP